MVWWLVKARRQNTDYNSMITRTNIDSIKEDEYLEKLENHNKYRFKPWTQFQNYRTHIPLQADLCETIEVNL
jgi:hypothetical protein